MTAAHDPTPLVTIVMPVFNGARTLRQSVSSVLDQSFRDFELVIVNDASTDETRHIAEEIAREDPRVRVVTRERSGGPAVARNSGIAQVRGRFLAFCDADDLWLPTKLERQLALARTSGAPLVYSAYHRVASDYAGTGAHFHSEGRVVKVPQRLTYARLLRHNYVGNLTALVDLERTGPVAMPDIQGAEDWALWLNIVREHGSGAGIREPLALYRAAQAHSHSANRGRAIRAVWTVLRQREHLAPPTALFHLMTNVFLALKKSRI